MAVEEGRYSRVTRRIWGDEKFRALSAAKPNAQTLLFRLLTGPELGIIPGLFAAREAGLADALGWPVAPFRKCWKEIESKGMVSADWKAGLVWVHKAVNHNPPANPNVVKGWRDALVELPECGIKREAVAALTVWLKGYGKGWDEPFANPLWKGSGRGCAEGSGKGFRKQEQDQDLDQEQEQEQLSEERARAHGNDVSDGAKTIESIVVAIKPLADAMDIAQAVYEFLFERTQDRWDPVKWRADLNWLAKQPVAELERAVAAVRASEWGREPGNVSPQHLRKYWAKYSPPDAQRRPNGRAQPSSREAFLADAAEQERAGIVPPAPAGAEAKF